MTTRISYRVKVPDGADGVLVPGGMETPYGRCLSIDGNGMVPIREETTGQSAFWISAPGDRLELDFLFSDEACAYPESMFVPGPSQFTRYAEDLVAEVQKCAGDLQGLECARAIACHTAERFVYGHPEEKFAEGLDEIPALGCGITEGSCVDINTYFIAALRLVGIETGYLTGYYFPEEKAGRCEDGHCWVVTRIGEETHEWDIAHHLKMGTHDIHPSLNPKPGQRRATFHSMGLRFSEPGEFTLKALIEPLALVNGRFQPFDAPEIRIQVPAIA